MTDEVYSVDQDAGKQNVHELQGIDKQGETAVWELPSVVTVEQLLSSESISEKRFNNEEASIKAAAQPTTGVEEILLLDPP